MQFQENMQAFFACPYDFFISKFSRVGDFTGQWKRLEEA